MASSDGGSRDWSWVEFVEGREAHDRVRRLPHLLLRDGLVAVVTFYLLSSFYNSVLFVNFSFFFLLFHP